jgi:glycosyltransferase involved in cell wall biosynthesis
MIDSKPYKVIFLNQMAGPMFRELAEDISEKNAPGLLLTGHPDALRRVGHPSLTIEAAPVYQRRSIMSRLASWLAYFAVAIKTVRCSSRGAFLFMVSNPPFLGLIGVLFKALRKQRYGVLIYDVYPDVLLGMGRMRSRLVAWLWNALNRKVYAHADFVATLCPDMVRRIKAKCTWPGRSAKRVRCIPPWADLEWIRPLPKSANPFAKEHRLQGVTTVLYSGNMGHTHSVERLLEVAKLLALNRDVRFLLIGEGPKWSVLKNQMERDQLYNVTLLPFQPEHMLPYSMSSGDIGVITYETGTEGCMLPSKVCYYMAAGLAVLVISEHTTDIAELVTARGCGFWFRPTDVKGMAAAIEDMHEHPEKLMQYKTASRKTAEEIFSRKNSDEFIRLLERIHCNKES